jgi:tRNA threonylcarbamoyladenosine biosynthesis protein TsaB
MIILLDTSSAVCDLTFIDGEEKQNYKWQSDRGLAKGLLAFMDEKLKLSHKTWSDISALGVYKGPGSFTGLRIGITVLNTISDANNIPIVGCSGDDWQDEAVGKIKSGVNDKIVLPFYGREARITQPRK